VVDGGQLDLIALLDRQPVLELGPQGRP